MKILFLLCCALLFPELAYAQSPFEGNPLQLTPSTQDTSVIYLGYLFGTVEGVLHGSGSQILGVMFKNFNAAVLALASIVVMYTFVVSTLNTAHSGDIMGKNWSSIWIPIRTATGIGLMVPKQSGYSTIQVIVLWIVLQGIGAANSVWGAALDYLNKGGVIVQQSLDQNNEMVTKKFPPLFKSMVCMSGLQNGLEKYQRENPPQPTQFQSGQTTGPQPPMELTTPVPSFFGSIVPFNDTSPEQIGQVKGYCDNFPDPKEAVKVCFPNFPKTEPYSKYNGICGSFTLPKEYAVTQKGTGFPEYIPEKKTYIYPTKKIAMQQALLELNGNADRIATGTCKPYPPPVPPGLMGQSPDCLPWQTCLKPYRESSVHFCTPIYNSSQPTLSPVPATLFGDVGQSYEGIMYPAMTGFAKNISDAVAKSAKNNGWILAGRYYFDLANTNTKIRDVTSGANLTVNPPSSPTEIMTKFPSPPPGEAMKYMSPLLIKGGFVDQFVEDATRISSEAEYGRQKPIKISADALRGASAGFGILNYILPGFGGIMQVFMGIMVMADAQKNNLNPVVLLAFIGSGLLDAVFAIWLYTAIALGLFTTAVGSIPSVTISSGTSVFASWVIPFLTVLMVSAFYAGAMLAYYVPLVPFLVFLFTSLGWFVAVLEAVIAAPLVALGLAYPEGQHEVFGHAANAVMMIVNVFLRPMLMIFGLIAGIILSYIGVWLLNLGFSYVAGDMVENLHSLAAFFFVPIVLAMIYTSTAVTIVEKAFGLIHILPDKVTRWLGGGGETFGSEFGQAAGEVKGIVGQGMQAFGSGLGQATGKGIEAAGKKADAAALAKAEKAKAAEKEASGGDKDKGGGGGGTPPAVPGPAPSAPPKADG